VDSISFVKIEKYDHFLNFMTATYLNKSWNGNKRLKKQVVLKEAA